MKIFPLAIHSSLSEISFQPFHHQSCPFKEPNTKIQRKQRVQCAFLWKKKTNPPPYRKDALFRGFRKLKRCLLSAPNSRASIRKRTKMNSLFLQGASASGYTEFASNLAALTASPHRLVNQPLSPGAPLLLGCLKTKPFPTTRRKGHVPCLNFLFC